MTLPARVRLVEVGPRDGLQNEPVAVAVAARISLIDRLSACGFEAIEAGSFVSPKWVAQMAGSGAVLAGVTRRPGTVYSALVPNPRGLDDALAARADRVAVFAAASETFSRHNINCGVAASLDRLAPVIAAARRHGVPARGYVSCALGCPYEGAIDPRTVAALAERLVALGCDEISLGDTIGTGTAGQARAMVETVAERVPVAMLAAHFHDTYGQALANTLAVLEKGVAVIDCSVGGLGGCPYAGGTSGNLASEDVLYMLNGLGIITGVDLDRVIAAGHYICGVLGRPNGSKVARAKGVCA